MTKFSLEFHRYVNDFLKVNPMDYKRRSREKSGVPAIVQHECATELRHSPNWHPA